MQQFAYRFPEKIQNALIRCYSHLGGSKIKKEFQPYVFDRREDADITIIDIQRMWEKFVLAARVICAYDNPADIFVSSSKIYGFKAVQRFCEFTGCTNHTGRFVPGMFTNQIEQTIREPRLIIVADPYADSQAIKEAAKMGIPVIAFANTDNNLAFVDVAIPANNRSLKSIAANFCVLAKLVNEMKGLGSMTDNIEIDIERFFYRDPAEIEKLAAEHQAANTDEAVEHAENDQQAEDTESVDHSDEHQ